MSACSRTTYEVSLLLPLNSVTLYSLVCCSTCQPAARALGLLPSASPRKSDYLTRTTVPAVPVLTDATRACSTRLLGGGGGSEATAVAPECTGAHL